MPGPFHSIVLFAEMRTGSNLLEANLNALEGVTSYGEVFNPHFIGTKGAEDLLGITLAEREANPPDPSGQIAVRNALAFRLSLFS